MTEEQIKAKAKEQFPNDEFKQQAIINAINWATKELQEEIKACKFAMAMSEKVEKQLREQIEKMKNCNNCCNFEKDEDGLWNCKKGSFFCNCMGKGCKEWELAE